MAVFVRRMRALKRQALTVWFAARDRRMPWGLKLLALAVAAYAFSPIDLVPDFIPVLGLLDDLLLIPLGIALVVKLAPEAVMDDARAHDQVAADKPVSRVAACVIVLLWCGAAGLAWLLWRRWIAVA